MVRCYDTIITLCMKVVGGWSSTKLASLPLRGRRTATTQYTTYSPHGTVNTSIQPRITVSVAYGVHMITCHRYRP